MRAGLFSFIRPATPEALVSQAVRLDPHVHESWLRTPPALLAETLAPLVSSPVGSLWRDSETLRGDRRERLEVLALLDAAGLGEGAGYKALERTIPWCGAEHVMLALLMERRQPVPLRSEAMLAALSPAIERAILRIGLPLLGDEPVLTQLMAEQSLGYLCVSPTGSLVTMNVRALRLVDRYADAASVVGRRGAVAAFAARALEQIRKQQPWQLASDESAAILQVDVHRLAKETHALSEDVILVQMRRSPRLPVREGALARASLTRTQLTVAMLFATTGASDEELGQAARRARGHGAQAHGSDPRAPRRQLSRRDRGADHAVMGAHSAASKTERSRSPRQSSEGVGRSAKSSLRGMHTPSPSALEAASARRSLFVLPALTPPRREGLTLLVLADGNARLRRPAEATREARAGSSPSPSTWPAGRTSPRWSPASSPRTTSRSGGSASSRRCTRRSSSSASPSRRAGRSSLRAFAWRLGATSARSARAAAGPSPWRTPSTPSWR